MFSAFYTRSFNLYIWLILSFIADHSNIWAKCRFGFVVWSLSSMSYIFSCFSHKNILFLNSRHCVLKTRKTKVNTIFSSKTLPVSSFMPLIGWVVVWVNQISGSTGLNFSVALFRFHLLWSKNYLRTESQTSL